MSKFFAKSAKWCLGTALLAGAAIGGGHWTEPVQAEQRAALTPAQQREEAWMRDEARRKVAEQNWTKITVIRANLETLDVFGTCTRKLSNGTTINKDWIVRFIVVGSGSARQLQAQAPIYR